MNTKFLACLVFAILASVDASEGSSAPVHNPTSFSNISSLNKESKPKSTRKDIKSTREYIESNRNRMVSNRLGRICDSQNEPLIKPWMLFIAGAAIILPVAFRVVLYWRSRDSFLIDEEIV